MRWVNARLALALTATALAAAAAGAQVEGELVYWGQYDQRIPAAAAAYNPTSANIEIGGYLLFPIRTPAAGFTVAEREAIVLRRLTEIFSSGKIGPVYVASVRGLPTIYVDRIRLVTVYPQDVAASGLRDGWELAEAWAARVRKGLELTAPARVFNGPPYYTVRFGREDLFRVFDAAGLENLRTRGETIEARLAQLAPGCEPSSVATAVVQNGVAVTCAGQTICVATEADVKAAGVASPQALADTWAEAIRRGLAARAPAAATPPSDAPAAKPATPTKP